jgi:phosphatidylserine decarboxylase
MQGFLNMKKLLFRLMLFVISTPVFSRTWGWITRRKHPGFIVKRAIKKFASHHGVKIDEFTGSTGDYTSLSNFFLRPLNPDKRPLLKQTDCLLSPADGYVQQYEPVLEGMSTQIKGIKYSISELINRDFDSSKDWFITTIYLSPADYHRYHYPADAELTGYCHLSGRLYPVNHLGIQYIKRLFIKNERIVVEFQKAGSKFYLIAIGASFVGSIKMNFIPKIKRDNQWHNINLKINQIEEMGCFQMGSTIVLVTPGSLTSPLEGVNDKKIKVGQPLLKLLI